MSAEEMKISSLSDIEFDRLGQHDADTDAELELMTADTAVAAAKKMLRQRHHMCKNRFFLSLIGWHMPLLSPASRAGLMCAH